ncbi:MAG: phage holin family protein [Deltaproteobacteria bacterium]|nr:phage holin family protein [Deltaproteobacteria bacterium]MBI3388340.1 phage holin family protein [Deltaproteobacteria bacterium]
MRGLVIRWLVTAFALWLTSLVVSGIQFHRMGAVFVAAVVLGIFNAFLRPLVLIFTLPINLLTLGLFTFVINGFMLWLTSEVVKGFEVHGFWSAVFGALLLSVFSLALSAFVSDSGRIQYIYVERIER